MEDQKNDDFYAAAKQQSERKKAEQNETYAVAPKLPRSEGTVEGTKIPLDRQNDPLCF